MSDGAGKYERLIESAIENLSRHFFDSYEESNAKFRTETGLKMIVVREEIGDCCSWCADLAGVYDYDSAPKEVWARHANCRCMVVTKTERGTYQDAWSRKEYASEQAARAAREQEILIDLERARAYNKGAISGALNDKNDPDGVRREQHAIRYYNSVRNSNKKAISEVISRNTGIEEELINKMLEHVFINEYDLTDGYGHFDPDYDMAESIRRLREGRDIQKHDIILIRHEALEYDLMNQRNMSYENAHAEAEAAFNYAKALNDWKQQE